MAIFRFVRNFVSMSVPFKRVYCHHFGLLFTCLDCRSTWDTNWITQQIYGMFPIIGSPFERVYRDDLNSRAENYLKTVAVSAVENSRSPINLYKLILNITLLYKNTYELFGESLTKGPMYQWCIGSGRLAPALLQLQLQLQIKPWRPSRMGAHVLVTCPCPRTYPTHPQRKKKKISL